MRRRVTLLSRGLAATAALMLVMLMGAPPSFAAPTLTISATEGLSDGQTVTISGAGFAPGLTGIAIGQCIEGYGGPGDCNIAGGAKFRDADGSGNVASFDIVVKEKFGAFDCTTQTCVIAAAPLPNASDEATIAANTYIAEISFGAVEAPAATTTPEATATTTPEAAPIDDGGSLPKTGAGDSVPVLLLGATALLAAGAGVILLVPGRRRGEHR